MISGILLFAKYSLTNHNLSMYSHGADNSITRMLYNNNVFSENTGIGVALLGFAIIVVRYIQEK